MIRHRRERRMLRDMMEVRYVPESSFKWWTVTAGDRRRYPSLDHLNMSMTRTGARYARRRAAVHLLRKALRTARYGNPGSTGEYAATTPQGETGIGYVNVESARHTRGLDHAKMEDWR